MENLSDNPEHPDMKSEPTETPELTEDEDSIPGIPIHNVEPAEKGQMENLQNKLMRLQADFDNFRRRNNSAKQEAREEARREILSDLLPVYDNFLRALRHSDEQEEYSGLRNGLEGIRAQMESVFRSNGLEEIPARPGMPFDPNVHEAAGSIPSHEADEHTIAQEILKGFTHKGNVVRPSQVLVFTREN